MFIFGVFGYALECSTGALTLFFFLVELKLKPMIEHYQKHAACPAVCALHQLSTFAHYTPGKGNWQKLYCNKHNADIGCRTVMIFSILNSGPSLFPFHQAEDLSTETRAFRKGVR